MGRLRLQLYNMQTEQNNVGNLCPNRTHTELNCVTSLSSTSLPSNTQVSTKFITSSQKEKILIRIMYAI